MEFNKEKKKKKKKRGERRKEKETKGFGCRGNLQAVLECRL